MTHSIELIAEDTLIIRSHYANPERDSGFVFELNTLLATHFSHYIRDCVPAYSSIMVVVDLNKTQPQTLANELSDELSLHPLKSAKTEQAQLSNSPHPAGDIIEIPCYYGEDVAWDLNSVAEQCERSTEEIIKLHCNTNYRVYAIGFSPGFPYLGYLPEPIQLPRKNDPRPRIPAGSVAIAENQSAIYPQATPGGWHIIGRTPLTLFRPELEDSKKCALRTGDIMRFVPIDKHTFVAMGGDLND